MTYPKTVWNYSKLTEALRILQIAYNIKNQFYQKKGFFVLPYNVSQNPKAIFFPKLNYRKIPNFWKKVKENSEILLMKKDSIIEEVIKLLPDNILDFTHLKKSWETTEENFWHYINNHFRAFLKLVKSLEIRPTKYGSIATAYSTWIKNNDQKIIVYIRSDADFSHIPEAIFLERFKKKLINYSWEEIEAIIDFLLTETELVKFFGKYKKTLEYLRKFQQGKLISDSKKYLQFLGFPINKIFNIENGEILVNGKKLPVRLSLTEEKILYFLINRRGKIVSFDQLADVVWGKQSYDKFSIYAITKFIQRLREKIKIMGVFPEIIQTVKKKGYLLID